MKDAGESMVIFIDLKTWTFLWICCYRALWGSVQISQHSTGFADVGLLQIHMETSGSRGFWMVLFKSYVKDNNILVRVGTHLSFSLLV